MPQQIQNIAVQQVLLDDNSVFSIQWSILPAHLALGMSAEVLTDRYLNYIRACTKSIIRPCQFPEGLEFRLLGSRLSLISFLPPSRENSSVVLRICGGLLVQPKQCHRGELRFEVAPDGEGVKVSLQLSDYCPLLLGSPSPSLFRHWLYRLTQAAIHRLVTVRFLVLLYRDLVGAAIPVRVDHVKIKEGRPV